MIFSLLQAIFVKVGAISNRNDSVIIGPRIISFGILILIIQMLGNISSIFFIQKNISLQLEKCLFAILQIAALTSVIYSLIQVWIYWEQLFEIAEQIEEIQGDFVFFAAHD